MKAASGSVVVCANVSRRPMAACTTAIGKAASAKEVTVSGWC